MKRLIVIGILLFNILPCYAKGGSGIHHEAGKHYGNKVNEGSYVLKYQVERIKQFKATDKLIKQPVVIKPIKAIKPKKGN